MELRIEHLTKKYGEKVALRDFSYTFTPGIYGILGANGAGKSTLMNLITDNVKRTDGQIRWDGTDILKLGKRFRGKLGYMPQQQGMYNDFSARAFLRYMAQIKEIPKKQADEQIEQLLDVVNLREDAHKKVGGFSGGIGCFVAGFEAAGYAFCRFCHHILLVAGRRDNLRSRR